MNTKIQKPILDSKHIIATNDNQTIVKSVYEKHSLPSNRKIYNAKLVDCGSYIQIYYYQNKKSKKQKKEKLEEFNLSKIQLKLDCLNTEKETKSLKSKNKIEDRSLIRSKLQCQRIAKCNMKDWQSFITLTFKDNVIDLNQSWKKLHSFITIVQRKIPNFKYLCVTEFQKRGAVHYHLLTNISCCSDIVPKRPKKELYNPNTKTYKVLEYYDIKYWNNGFSSAEPLKDDPKKVVGYISKYMTKDIDNRLFNRRRYFYSRNLETPKISYINLDNNKEHQVLIKKIQDKTSIYQNEYTNSIDNSIVTFLEYQ